MKCPHCNKKDNNPDHGKAECNAENYGGSRFVFACSHCKSKYQVCMFRAVKIGTPTKIGQSADLSF